MGGVNINAQAGYGSEDRYLGRQFGMIFSGAGQYSFYFNTNNLNESRRPGQQTSWTPDKMPTGVRKTIAGGFDYNIKTLDNHWELSGNVNAETTRETDGTDIVRTNYLVSGSTYDYQFNRTLNKSWAIGTSHKLYYKTKGGYGIAMEPYFNYNNWNYWGQDVNATFNETFNNMSTDFIQNIYGGDSQGALASLLNRNIEMNRQKGHSISTGTNLWQGYNIPGTNDMLVLNLVGKYDNKRDERFNHYDINFGQDATPAQSANRYFKNFPDFGSDLTAELNYTRKLAKMVTLSLTYGYNHVYHKSTSNLYNLDNVDDVDEFMLGKLPSAINYELSLDRGNSYLSRNTENNHKLDISLNYGDLINSKLWIQIKFPFVLSNRRLDYQRATVDTTVTRRSVLFNITDTYFQYRFNKNSDIFLRLQLQSRTPDLVSMVDMTDTTNPLYTMKGNGSLKNALRYNAYLSYRYKGFVIVTEYTKIDNALSQGYTYNSSTGVREGRYYNVDGNWSVNGDVNYRKQIKNLTVSNNFVTTYTTSVDLIGQDTPELIRSKVYNLQFMDRFWLTYNLGKSSIGLNVKAQHDRFTSNLADFTQQNTWTVSSGVNATLELPANFQLSTDFTVYNRRGYTDQALNTDNFVWNARLTYRALKGNLLLMLDGYDMLHDLSNVSYSVAKILHVPRAMEVQQQEEITA